MEMSEVNIAAVNWVEETKVVVLLVPFHLTTAPETKLLPLTVRVKAPPPAVAELGDRVLIAGTGLLIVKVRAPEVPPPGAGLKTVTLAVPAVAMSVVVIEAVSWVEEPKVVVRSPPFHRTTDPETKFVPLTVRVKTEPPAVPD